MAAEEAARVIDIALLLKQGRLAQIKVLGYTEATAMRYALKRRRGLTGAYIGTTVIELLGSVENKTQAALRTVIEHGLPVALASRIYGIDRRNLLRLVRVARLSATSEAIRKKSFSQRTKVTNYLFHPDALDPQANFLPKNTTP